jgi:tetratricopeptide (TPR) repeat protein
MFEALIVLLAQQMPFSVVAKMTGLSWYYVHEICSRYVDEAVDLTDLSESLGEREAGTARLLEEAVTAYRDALLEYTRERVPLQWATTQNNLGNALKTLGARESGTARLEEAVSAYRDALLERTRDRVPLQWAMTQNNLKIVLRLLEERQ